MLLDKLANKGLINPPPFILTNTQYLTIMGSHAYGVADTSVKAKIPDYDVYGFAIPPKDYIFPHLTGYVDGFGTRPPRFEQYQKHSVMDEEALGGKGQEWDLQIFNIVKYFELCRQNNPNMIDSLYTPDNCVIHCTEVGRLVRDNRKLFLSKECWKKYRGYAFSQLKKMQSKNPIGGRKEIVETHGFDTKFAYHILRLYDEAEQILLFQDINLQRAKEVMKAVRRGEWTAEQVEQWAIEKDKNMEEIYLKSDLPERPNEERLRQLLLQCLEIHYGSLEKCVANPDWAQVLLRDIDHKIYQYRDKIYS